MHQPKDVIDSQVNVIKLELLETRPDGIRDVLDVCDDFRRDEQLAPVYTTFLDSHAELCLSLVYFRSIKVGVLKVSEGVLLA